MRKSLGLEIFFMEMPLKRYNSFLLILYKTFFTCFLIFVLSVPFKASFCEATELQKEVKEEILFDKSFESFSEFRSEVINLFGDARTRIWILTDYLTDGEIASALYLAKYRKIDVKVLLGRRKVNDYMSRLSFLKGQNISVFLKPDSFEYSSPSGILIDEKLFRINCELNFMSLRKPFEIKLASAYETAAFNNGFQKAYDSSIDIKPRELPQAGHPKQPAVENVFSGHSGDSRVYNYDVSKSALRKPPEGVPRSLPKVPKYELKSAPNLRGEQIQDKIQMDEKQKSKNSTAQKP
ncbi:MAG: hypothetical protein HQK54_02045 [Oligoflexales bacterium]|nr:hypothetical protein [Oligoflexales bacterium]